MTSQSEEVLQTLEKLGAIIRNSHIVYTSGKHGSVYVNKDALYPHTAITSRLCLKMAEHFAKSAVEVVVAPVIGGVILSQWVAHHLSELKRKEVAGVYAEKEGDGFVIKRGYARWIAGRNVLVVEDILNTGGSVKKVVEAVRSVGGTVIGVAALVNRGKVTPQEIGNVPELHSLADVSFEAWESSACPFCARQVPVNTEIGKGREFLKKI